MASGLGDALESGMRAPAALCLLLCGCGTSSFVRMPGRVPATPQEGARACALRSAYAVVSVPSAWVRPEPLAAGLARVLAKGGLGLRAWRSGPAAADPFAEALAPSGVVFVAVSAPSVRSSSTSAVHQMRFSTTARVDEYPSGRTLAELRAEETLSEESAQGSEEWMRGALGRALAKAGESLGERLLPKTKSPTRRIFRRKGDRQSGAALALARRGRWEEAERAWSGRAEGPGAWRELNNLAVAAESRGERERALELYEKARLASAGDPEAARIAWHEIRAELSEETPCARTRPTRWFARRIAVLPFSDQVTSLDGPELARRLLHQELARAGLDVMALEAVDAVLKGKGFTQGGQLVAARADEIAAWLGADLVLYCDVEDYNEISLGIYHRRSVAGTLKVVDASGKVLWQGREAAMRQAAGGKALQRLAGQLARSWIERLKKSPLKEEAEAFAAAAAARLPRPVPDVPRARSIRKRR